jgi:hypothetical protein
MALDICHIRADRGLAGCISQDSTWPRPEWGPQRSSQKALQLGPSRDTAAAIKGVCLAGGVPCPLSTDTLYMSGENCDLHINP